MRSNGLFSSVLGIAAVAALSIWVAAEHQARLALGEEHQVLEERVAQLSELTARNEPPSNLAPQATPSQSLTEDQFRELLRLRGEAGVLRRQLAELETARAVNLQARAAQASRGTNAVATADYWPREAWAFTGYGSPEATLQSSLWAANNGNLKSLAAGTTDEVQKMMAQEFEGKSETEASIKLMDDLSTLKSVRILSREAQGDDTAVLTAAFEGRGGTHTTKLVIKKVGNDWKLASVPQ